MSPVLYDEVIKPMADGVGVIGGLDLPAGSSSSSLRLLLLGVTGVPGLGRGYNSVVSICGILSGIHSTIITLTHFSSIFALIDLLFV